MTAVETMNMKGAAGSNEQKKHNLITKNMHILQIFQSRNNIIEFGFFFF